MWDSDDCKEYREAQQKRRAERLPVRQEEIEAVKDKYNVVKLTSWQYRINGMLDLFPIHKRFHNIKNNKRGNYKTVLEIINQQLN